MEDRTLQAFLRVLYTVNNNPQYILAKSLSRVPAIVCSERTTRSSTNELAYARAPLKACLMAVCDSSPELLQDPARDFSLYVLDPLEAQPLPTTLSDATHNNGSPRGVAVALGLMSWALESNDSMDVFVTGTIIPNASPALEVIFALRETKRMPKPMLHSYPSSASIFTPVLSQPYNALHPPQPAWMNWPPTSYAQRDQQEQRTLTRSADFPELYIGPPRRAPGRPEGSTSSKAKVKSQPSSSSLPGTSPVQVMDTRSDSKQEVRRSSKQKTKARPPRPPPTHSPFICEPLSRSTTTGHSAAAADVPALYQQSHSFHPTHNQLLGLRSVIPSTSSSNSATKTAAERHATLLSALQEFLVANPHLLQLAATNAGHSPSVTGQPPENIPSCGSQGADVEHDDADSDIVILDSSTVDTTAFRKPSHREFVIKADTDPSLLVSNQGSPMPSSHGTVSSLLPASTLPSGLEVTRASSQTSIPTVAPRTKTPTCRHASSEQTVNRKVTPSQVLGVLATPTPTRTHKRKLDEYIQGQVHSSVLVSPPSPSPPVTRTSGSGRTLAVGPRVRSSPTYEIKPVGLPSVRLPSMLGSMRNMSTSRNGASDTRRRFNLNLNDVMEEHEARKNTKVRKRPSSGRNAEVSANGSQSGPSRSSKFVSTSRYTQSSPPRPLFRSGAVTSTPAATTYQPTLRLGAAVANPVLPKVTASTCATPSTSTLIAASTKNPLKNFVMPAWARTSTATLPRLSEEVLARQRAEQEAKKSQVSLRRREAARAKRQRLRYAGLQSSDEDEDAVANDPKPQVLHLPSGISRSAVLPPVPPSLPVFASDVVEPLPSSPPLTHQQLAPPAIPSTPPRKPISPSSAPHHTPNKSGSCSLFTPSGQDLDSLFTPSTPSVTRPLNRAAFTPRSPTALHRSSPKKSPRKSVPETPRTPKRNGASHHTRWSSRSGTNAPFVSPSLVMRTPQTQMATRAFLLPPPSPCSSKTTHEQRKVPGGGTPLVPGNSEMVKQESPSNMPSVTRNNGSDEENTLVCQPDDPFIEDRGSPARLNKHDEQGTGELLDINATNDASRGRAEYASSPLPPSSPLPASPFSSPTKHHDSDFDTPTIDNLIVPDSDILLPSASDSEGPRGLVDTTWLTDSDASAWLTETEAWLTDTEGGPLLTDSDGAWPSDPDAVFGISSLPPSSASNWFSDDADVDTDGESGATGAGDGEFDVAALERVYAALVECGGQTAVGKDEDGGNGATGVGLVESESWESIWPLLGVNGLEDTGAAMGHVGDAVDESAKVAQDFQELLNGLVST